MIFALFPFEKDDFWLVFSAAGEIFEKYKEKR